VVNKGALEHVFLQILWSSPFSHSTNARTHILYV
jgi:hypothetical protein